MAVSHVIFLTLLSTTLTFVLAQNVQSHPGCVLEAVPLTNGKSFRTLLAGIGYRSFPCPPNTRFNPNTCVCDWVENPVNPPGGTNLIPGGGVDTTGLPGMGMSTPSTTKPPCPWRASLNRHQYEEFVLGFEWMKRDCPRGTLYNAEACGCHDRDPNQIYTCSPEVWINFNGGVVEDSAGQHVSIGNNGNVQSNITGAGRFDGTGTLTVWKYKHMEVGDELTINFRFYEFRGGVSSEQVLLSNCYGRQLGSVEIAINQDTKEVIFRAATKVSEPVELRLAYPEKAWKNVTLLYNGQNLIGQVGNELTSVPLKGPLQTRFNSMQIGSCNERGFVGYIDDLRIFECLFPTPEITQLMGTTMGNELGFEPRARGMALP